MFGNVAVMHADAGEVETLFQSHHLLAGDVDRVIPS